MKEYDVLSRLFLFCIATIILSSCDTENEEKEIKRSYLPKLSKTIVVKTVAPGSIIDSYIKVELIDDSLPSEYDIQYIYLYDCDKVVIGSKDNTLAIYINKGSIRYNFINSQKVDWFSSNDFEESNNIDVHVKIDSCLKYLDYDEYVSSGAGK